MRRCSQLGPYVPRRFWNCAGLNAGGGQWPGFGARRRTRAADSDCGASAENPPNRNRSLNCRVDDSRSSEVQEESTGGKTLKVLRASGGRCRSWTRSRCRKERKERRGLKVANMAAALDEDDIDNDDYYSLLNVRREATQDELKASYRRLCMLYHPDKHRDPELKGQAERLFNLVHQAYEVLSDPQARAIYDIYGKRGLEVEGWEVVERKRTPAEIREEFERLQRERDERRLQQRTNPKGTISVGVDATDLFDHYEDDYEDMPGGGFPHIEINKMHISQSIEAPLTTTDTAILSGSLSTQNGNGGGNISLALRRVTSAKGWGELEFGAGDTHGPLFGMKIFHNLTPRCFVTAQCGMQFSSRGVRPGLSTVLARHLDKNTMGYLQWRWGAQSSMNTSIVRDTKTSHFTLALQLGIPHSFMMMSYQYKFQDEDQTKIKGSVKSGFFGTVVEYGAERKISRHSVLGATVSIGVPQGVSLKIKLNRASQTYFFPIHLTDQILPSAVFYATVGPLVFYLAVDRLIIRPYVRAQKEQDLEKQRESLASGIARKKQEAEAAVLLMQESVRRIVEAEESRMGLIILNAWYGKFVTDNSRKHERAKVIDVTVPLQCLVKDSKLILTEATKSGLPGFYDPCVGEEKSLKVLYQFRGVMHQVLSGDTEALRIPKQSHRIDTDT
uniref:DnaJ homolog subfamily C member 11 n=2 Tax=Scleropages formosus TaxID=113540 RepID=A0A8C9W829_SCLFO